MGTWWVLSGPAEIGLAKPYFALLIDPNWDPSDPVVEPLFWWSCLSWNPDLGLGWSEAFYATVYASEQGACCTPGEGENLRGCLETTLTDCDALGGSYLGDFVACGADLDEDGVPIPCDNCLSVPNPSQGDCDGDGQGDACESDPAQGDDDGDGLCNGLDTCPDDPDNDADADGICGDVDVCPNDFDNDKDGDGFCGDVDICPNDPSCTDALVVIDCRPLVDAEWTALDTVEVECVLTAISTATIQGFQLDLPCDLPGQAGSNGRVFAVSVSVDVAHTSPPFLFGSSGLAEVNESMCQLLGATLLENGVTIQAGESFYLGTIVYQVGECAGGAFDLVLEGVSAPPSLNDGTRLRPPTLPGGNWTACTGGNADCPSGVLCSGDTDPVCGFISNKLTPASIAVTSGTCCNGLTCLADGINDVCCENLHPGARFDAGNTCEDFIACGCGGCQLHADVFPLFPSGNCFVDIDDVLTIIGGFSAADPCLSLPFADLVPCDTPCSTVDIDDVLAVLAAFSGDYLCDHPCAPGACCFTDGNCEDGDGLQPGTTPIDGMSYSVCLARGGSYIGDHTVCLGDGDGDGTDDVCP